MGSKPAGLNKKAHLVPVSQNWVQVGIGGRSEFTKFCPQSTGPGGGCTAAELAGAGLCLGGTPILEVYENVSVSVHGLHKPMTPLLSTAFSCPKCLMNTAYELVYPCHTPRVYRAFPAFWLVKDKGGGQQFVVFSVPQ